MSALALALGMTVAGLSGAAPGPATLEPPPIRIGPPVLVPASPRVDGRSRPVLEDDDSRRGDWVGAAVGAVILGGLANGFACGIADNTDGCGFVWQAALPAAVIGAIIGAGIGSAF